jgi:hypothetical protein
MHLNVFVKNNSVIRQAYLILVLINKEIRESTFISPRGGDEDILKKAHIFTGLFRLLVNFLGGHRKFSNNPVQVIGKFSMPPSRFLKFSMPPPPEFGMEGVQSGILSYHRYNLQFLKMSDILKHMFM